MLDRIVESKKLDYRKLDSTQKCGNVLSNVVRRKCLTKGRGSENLRPLMSSGRGLKRRERRGQ